MSQLLCCPRCQHDQFEIHITAFGVDRFDATDEDMFVLDRSVIEEPETIDVEAICRSCGHARYVPDSEWEWA